MNHNGDPTTSICEGYHSILKRVIRGEMGERLRVDRLIHHLLHFVTAEYIYREVRSGAGVAQNNLHRCALRGRCTQRYEINCSDALCETMHVCWQTQSNVFRLISQNI